jgi:hypothetical protein
MTSYEENSQTIQDQENNYDSNDNDNHDDNHDDDIIYHTLSKNKLGRFQYFTSNSLSKRIVHAETNAQYDYKPGSFESLKLYNVILSTNVDKNDSLYYNSPEEYAQHRGIQLDKRDINSWHRQKERLFPGGNFNKQAYETIRKEKMEKRIKDQEYRHEKANKEAKQLHKVIEQVNYEETISKKPRKYRMNRSKVMNRSPMNHPLHKSWKIVRQMK